MHEGVSEHATCYARTSSDPDQAGNRWPEQMPRLATVEAAASGVPWASNATGAARRLAVGEPCRGTPTRHGVGSTAPV